MNTLNKFQLQSVNFDFADEYNQSMKVSSPVYRLHVLDLSNPATYDR